MGLVMRLALSILVFGLILAAGGQVARAQTVELSAPPATPELSPEEKTQRARQLFGRALERIDSGRFAEARDLLEESLELAPRVGTAFNLAVANRGMGELLAALELLEKLLDERFGILSKPQRREASTLRDELKAQLGHLELTLEGAPRAEVRVDGNRAGVLEERADPLAISVNPGRRIITLTAQDHKDEERSVHVAPGAQIPLAFKMALTEEAKTGRLIIDAAKKTDHIEIVGVGTAQGHIEEHVTPGTYTVRVTNEKGSKKTSLTVRPRSTVRYQFDDVKTSLFKRPLFWAGVGAVVTGVVVAAILTQPQAERGEPISDPTYDVVEARFPWR